jgi:hypothetical protein
LGYIGAIIGTVLTLKVWAIPSSLYEIAQSLLTSMAKVYPWKTVGRNLILAIAAGFPAGTLLWLMHDCIYLVQLAISSTVYFISYILALSAAGEVDIKRDTSNLWNKIVARITVS